MTANEIDLPGGENLTPYITTICSCLPLLVTHTCATLGDPMDCSPPSSSVHEILQARILEWVAIPFSGASSQPRGQTQVFLIAGRFSTL